MNAVKSIDDFISEQEKAFRNLNRPEINSQQGFLLVPDVATHLLVGLVMMFTSVMKSLFVPVKASLSLVISKLMYQVMNALL